MTPPTLRYCWQDLPNQIPQDTPGPPRASSLDLMVGDRVVWRGGLHQQLRQWARWCAYLVADRWACPEDVRRWLRTGRGSGWRNIRQPAATTAAPTRQIEAGNAAFYATIGLHTNIVWPMAQQASEAARHATDDPQAADLAQQAHLRLLILRRALPESRWPLIDLDERVVCDALLEPTQ